MDRFTLENERVGYKVYVRIYSTRRDMQRGINRLYPKHRALGADLMAACVPYDGPYCVLFFNRADLSHLAIAHECVHAAMSIFQQRRGCRPKSRVGEEFVATHAGMLTAGVIDSCRYSGVTIR